MQIQIQAEDLNRALDLVSIVTPQPISQNGGAGFRVALADGKATIMSRDKNEMSRAPLEVASIEGEGAFILPAGAVKSLHHLKGAVDIRPAHEEANERFSVHYETEDGATGELTSVDPMFVMPFDEELEASGSEFTVPAGILREALAMAKPYMAKPNDGREGDHLRTIQVFDKSKETWARGNGHLFSSTGSRALYFYCPVFEDKGLCIHQKSLGCVQSFLAKCQGDIRVRVGKSSTFLVNSKDEVVGWRHVEASHEKFGYFPLSRDRYILKVGVDVILRALKYVRDSMTKPGRVRVLYDHSESTLKFRCEGSFGKASSFPVKVTPLEEDHPGKEGKTIKAGSDGLSKDLALNADITHLISLFDSLKGHETSLRIVVSEKDGKRSGMLRTVDDFQLTSEGKVPVEEKEGSQQCRVTRFAPSRD